jgi:hypothetical protein
VCCISSRSCQKVVCFFLPCLSVYNTNIKGYILPINFYIILTVGKAYEEAEYSQQLDLTSRRNAQRSRRHRHATLISVLNVVLTPPQKQWPLPELSIHHDLELLCPNHLNSRAVGFSASFRLLSSSSGLGGTDSPRARLASSSLSRIRISSFSSFSCSGRRCATSCWRCCSSIAICCSLDASRTSRFFCGFA